MKIIIVTPAPAYSRSGNRVTAVRWQRMLKQLGHRVSIVQGYHGQPCELLIALHARRSHAAILKFSQLYQDVPLIVCLTGTDLYHDIQTDSDAQESLQLADRLIVLQPKGIFELPAPLHEKARVIYQSMAKLPQVPPKTKKTFDVCVIGHLRPVKDPFRAAIAVRDLPISSKIRVLHVGRALSEEMATRALAEMKQNARYCWLKERPRWETRRILARCQLSVLSSKMEGGAHAISESLVAAVPILASRISGSIGMLGEDYPGYFPVEDTATLRELLLKAEADGQFLETLTQSCERLAYRFEPAHELETWKKLLADFE